MKIQGGIKSRDIFVNFYMTTHVYAHKLKFHHTVIKYLPIFNEHSSSQIMARITSKSALNK